MSGELLLELLSEEIPARMQRRALADLIRLVGDRLAAASIPAESLDGYATPRRLALVARGIPKRQPDRKEERRGPRLGAPSEAIEGFLRSAGLSSLEQCETRGTGRGEFYFAIIDEPGREAAAVLTQIIEAAIAEFPWPKSMRFPAASFRWVRPLNSVVCLFDGAVVPLDLGKVPVGRTTRGHRFLAPAEFQVADAREYVKGLEAAHVVLDLDERKRRIEDGLQRLAAAEGFVPAPDPGLSEEVAGLAECPVVLIGSIDREFMDLPPEVLATAMRTHQKYFSCRYPDGKPAPRFLFVADNLAPDGGNRIVAGNERVLRARLADARFFWDQDRKIRLEDRVAALKERLFYPGLGNMYEKAGRIKKVAGEIAWRTFLDPRLRTRAEHAAFLAKADLSTAMVGEFPELQGIIGGRYALQDGEDSRVAQAIAEHYKPLGPNDSCPSAAESVAVALADKIDSLVGLFHFGVRPTGAGDPYALRRAALGVIRMILENRLPLRLLWAFLVAFKALRDEAVETDADLLLRDLMAFRLGLGGELLSFMVERLKVHLREQGVRHDCVDAVLKPASSGEGDDDLVKLVARAEAVQQFLTWDDGAKLLVAYKRSERIVRIEEERDGRSYSEPVNDELLQEEEERLLCQRLKEVGQIPQSSFVTSETFIRAMSALASLREPVDKFFGKVTVNTDDRELRANRLCLLAGIRDTMNQIADFSQIKG